MRLLVLILFLWITPNLRGQSFEWAFSDTLGTPYNLVKDMQGNFVVSGNSFVAKFDSTHNLLWYQEVDAYYIKNIVCDSNSNIYAAGVFGGVLTLGPWTVSTPYNAMYLAKFNPLGNVEWLVQSVSNDFSGADDLSIDHLGNPIVIGRFSDSLHL